MQMKKTILAIMPLICLSCQFVPTLETRQLFIDIKHKACYERPYTFSKKYIGPEHRFFEVDYNKCNKMIGYSPDEYARVNHWIEERRIDLDKKKK